MTFPARYLDPFAPMHIPVVRRRHPPVGRPRPAAARPRWDGPPPLVEPERDPVRLRREPEPVAGPIDPAASPPTPPSEPVAAASPPDVPESGVTDEERLREAFRELQAARQRVERDAERVQEEARADLVKKLFPVLDSLDRALSASTDESALADGVRLVREQFEQVLLGYGLERIESVGLPFDPTEHEALGVTQVDSETDHGKVLQEWEAGYRFAGRVLRAAKVTVGRRTASTSAPN